MNPLTMPKGAAKYISLQRLETQRLGKSLHYNWLGKVAYAVYVKVPLAQRLFQQYSTHVEPLLRAGGMNASYSKLMAAEYANMAPHLPKNATRVVGIGPGVAGLEAFFSRHYAGQKEAPEMVLIDKTGIDEKITYGFQPVATVYNSLALAKDTLTLNGHPADKVVLVEAEDAAAWAKGKDGTVDVVTSLIAWGFHFPVPTYLAMVVKLLKPTGVLMLDVRKDTEGMAQLKKAFGEVTVILDDAKFERALCAKPKQK